MKYIYLSGEVSAWDYPGCISANQTRHLISDARAEDPDSEITVILNSFGGDVTEGVAVYNLLRASRPVSVVISGIAASIASVIAMAGDHVAMYSNSSLYVHHAWTYWAEGNASQLKQRTEELEAADRVLIDAYMAKSGRTEAEIVELLDGPNGDGSSIDADRALELGLIDEVLDPATAVAAMLRRQPASAHSSCLSYSSHSPDTQSQNQETAKMSADPEHTPDTSAECGGDPQKNEEETVEIEKEVKETSDDDDTKKKLEELERKVEELTAAIAAKDSKLAAAQTQLDAAKKQVAAAARFRQVNAAAGQSREEAQLSFPELVAKIGYVRARKEHPELMQAYIDAENAKGSIRDENRK